MAINSEGISLENIVDTFCIYLEDDYYEWLNYNAKSFFTSVQNGNDWKAINERICNYKGLNIKIKLFF